MEEYWKNLIESKDSITEIPLERWDWKSIYGEGPGETKVKWGGFIEGVDQFDAEFFNISPREARLMDPQQRLFLQCVWHAIEDAGHNPKNLRGSLTGLFVGVESHDYADLMMEHKIPPEAYTPTGIAPSVLANRISFLLDLHGPSEPVSTACSSSLIAIHRAVRAMRQGDCKQAIAGGVNLMLIPKLYIGFSKAGMLSEEGRCKAFSDEAKGYVRGEGVGAIFLKPLSQAQKDGDTIYALIQGSAENHGGHANSLTAPNPNAQAELLKAAYRDAEIPSRTVTYIEAHGTGTPLGDPVEINGLKKAFGDDHNQSKQTPCYIGSVKSNIGHLETAAGIAGVIKTILAMRHRMIPQTLHCETLNPYIELQGTSFAITQKTKKRGISRGLKFPEGQGLVHLDLEGQMLISS